MSVAILLTVTTFKVYTGAGGRKVGYLNLNLCTMYILMVIESHLNICKNAKRKKKIKSDYQRLKF